MDKKDVAPEAPQSLVQSRIQLERITLETPALLNMIKHCQDKKELTTSSSSEFSGARGTVMGVLKNELNENILLVTQTTPEEKKGGKTMKQIMEADKDI